MSIARPGASSDESISQSVVEAVATAEGVAPEDLTPPLYDVVDPDALGRLFAEKDGASQVTGRVEFSYCGHDVTVWGDGTVSLDGASRD